MAWYWNNSGSKTHAVKTKSPNELGIYDMSGNVYEWCQDWYGSYNSTPQTNPKGPISGYYRVSRGGDCNDFSTYCRSSNRSDDFPESRSSSLGFRLAMTADIEEVQTANQTSALKEESKTAIAVDLGLPSGTLWADRNVGADSPEDYGDYFAWGETEPKSTYNWSTYKWCSDSSKSMTKYCTDSSYGYNGFTDGKNTLDLSDDAAYVNMGSEWRMPTGLEFQELQNKCTWIWTTLSSVNGYQVTGPNGNSIFLPAAGSYFSSNLDDAGSKGGYLSSLLDDFSIHTYLIFFGSGYKGSIGGPRNIGRTVRAVVR